MRKYGTIDLNYKYKCKECGAEFKGNGVIINTCPKCGQVAQRIS